MPLSEIPLNNAGRSGLAEGESDSSEDEAQVKVQNPLVEAGLSFLSTPSSLNGMLRNTTETGDVGQFSIKPSRVPHPLRSSSQHEHDGYYQYFGKQGTRYHNRRHDDGRPRSVQSYRVTTAPGMTSAWQETRQRPLTSSRNFRNDDFRTYSLSQNFRDGPVAKYRSYGNLRAPVDLPGFRPRSPFLYPTRLKRPGFRPTSPALSELCGTEAEPYTRTSQATIRRPSDPPSLYAMRRAPPLVHRHSNRSVPSLRNPSPSISAMSRARATPPLRNMQTPRPSSSLSVRSTVYSSRAAQPPSATWISRRSPSPAPLYYDYSEPFEEYNFTTANASVLSLMDQTIPEDKLPTVYHELEGNTKLSPSELHGDRDIAELEASSLPLPIEDGASIDESLNKKPMGKSQLKQDILLCLRKKCESDKAHEDDETFRKENVSHQRDTNGISSTSDTMGHHILSSSKIQARKGFSSRSSRLTRDVSISLPSLRLSNAVNESVDSLVASSFPNQDNLGLGAAEPENLKHSSSQTWKIPSLEFSGIDLTSRIKKTSEQELIPVRSYDGVAEEEPPTIFAPVPERSISSQSERLSRILSIDDDLDDNNSVIQSRRIGVSSYASTRLPNVSTHVVGGAKTSRKCEYTYKDVLPEGQAGSDKRSLEINDVSIQRSFDEYAASARVSRIRNVLRSSASLSDPDHVAPEDGQLQENLTHCSSINETQTKHYFRGPPRANLGPGLTRFPSNSSHNFFSPTNSPKAFVSCYNRPSTEAAENIPSVSSEIAASTFRRNQSRGASVDFEIPARKYALKLRHERASSTSASSSNNYPWTERPIPVEPPSQNFGTTQNVPKFRLKVKRASVSSNETGTAERSINTSEALSVHRVGVSNEIFRIGPFGRKSRSPILPRQNTSIDLTPVRTRFSESIVHLPSCASAISLQPPSHGLHFSDCRSFFSDDSSQCPHRGTLRRRFSQIKALATRASSLETVRRPERSLTGSALARSRTTASAHSDEGIVSTSNIKHANMRIRKVLRNYWHRGEDKLRRLGGKIMRRRPHRNENPGSCLGA